MTPFARRRLALGVALLTGVVVLCILHTALVTSLRPATMLTGWLLTGSVVILAAYNLRKRLTVLNLGSSAAWLQLHILIGMLTLPLFCLHLRFRWPQGSFEWWLAGAYLLTFASGVLGLLLTRLIPRRLTSLGEEVLFERIPISRRQVRLEAEQIVETLLQEQTPSVIPQFYLQHLQAYFDRPRHLLQHLRFSRRPLLALQAEMNAFRRYLSPPEQERFETLMGLIRTKNSLDCHYALQGALKLWLFIHIPLTAALLVFVFWHLLLTHAFAGGW